MNQFRRGLTMPKNNDLKLLSEQDYDFISKKSSAILLSSPKGARKLIFVIFWFFLAALYWASNAQIDEVTVGVGKVIPSKQLQTLQSLEKGVISNVLVSSGDKVQEGDILLVIDDTQLKNRIQKLQQDKKLTEEKINIYEDLIKDKLISKVEFINLKKELININGELSDVLDRVSRTRIKSPVNGVVQRVLFNTISSVVMPGNDLVEIVPINDELLIEAKIRPIDIGFIRPGQEVMVKFSAYDYAIYGGLKGELKYISADTIIDDDESYYSIRVKTKTNYLTFNKEQLNIIPGMTAGVDIVTGKKTILEYLLKPVLRAKNNSLRER